MLSDPFIEIMTSPAAKADNTAIWTVLIAQAVTIALFLLRGRSDRKLDQERRTRDMKRDVLLEVAPALQALYASLAEMTNPLSPIDQVMSRHGSAYATVAKLQAVADDATLESARKLMTLLGKVMLRLMAKRAEVGTDLQATGELINFWRSEMEDYPKLLADFATRVRSEIPLPLNSEMFRKGIEESNQSLFIEMDLILEKLKSQQSGDVRESQAGHPGQSTTEASDLDLAQQARFWEFQYLNRFLVHRTQLVMDWLVYRQKDGQETPVSLYDSELAIRVIAPGERVAIIQALEAHGLINLRNEKIEVTQKGLDYFQWRGPAPKPTIPHSGIN